MLKAGREIFPLTSVLLTSNYETIFFEWKNASLWLLSLWYIFAFADVQPPSSWKKSKQDCLSVKDTGKERLCDAWPAAPVVFTLSMSEKMQEKEADALGDLSPFI